jgi:hypothetical protein
MTVAVANSGERNRRPISAIGSGTRVELERRGRGLSRHGAETKWAGNKEELKRGRRFWLGRVSGEILGRGKKKVLVLTCGAHMSAR